MNSNRIKTRFGSYGVDVLVQEPSLRIASLYSHEGSERVTRSFAVVHYLHPDDSGVLEVHNKIVAGGSVGQSFIDFGFDVFKETETLVELSVDSVLSNLYAMMHLSEPMELAYHTYVLNVRKTPSDWVEYARVTEVHSPEHLTIDALINEYGDSAYYREEHPRRSSLLEDFRGFFNERVQSAC